MATTDNEHLVRFNERNATFKLLGELEKEREAQRSRYGNEHDDEHGAGHLVVEARRRLNIYGNTGQGLASSLQRRELFTAAALLIAAVETIDRGGAQS